MESPRSVFDFTAALKRLCADIVVRSPQFRHIVLSRVAFNVCHARRDVSHGLYATLTPLKAPLRIKGRKSRDADWQVETLRDQNGQDYYYLLSFYLPRFQNASFEEKLITVFHELWHISPEFDGDIRRHSGRCYAHGKSQRHYDEQMKAFAQAWLALDPPSHIYEFLSLNFDDLTAEYGQIVANHWRSPRIVRKNRASRLSQR